METERNDGQEERPLPEAVAVLEHLTGASRGTESWLHERRVVITLRAGRVMLSPAAATFATADTVGALRRSGPTYAITAEPGQLLWVNGDKVDTRLLTHGDVIEFGETGPLSRFRLYDAKHKIRWAVEDIIDDCIAYLRTSRQPLGPRLARAFGDLLWRLAIETSLLFRVAVLAAIAALAVLSYQQWRLSSELQASISRGAEQTESIATALARARSEALRPSDLARLREELSARVTSNIERLEVLEQHSRAAATVVADAINAVAFIQGAYGLREIATGRMLRQVVTPDGIPVTTPLGQPFLSMDGTGPVAEIQFTGTGFLLGPDTLVTNRHVARPWETAANKEAFAKRGHEPLLLKLVAYLPGRDEAIALEFGGASDDADLALLRPEDPIDAASHLDLASDPPVAGEEVILLGYPTGLRSMLAQSGLAFIEELHEAEDVDFWSVASRLAARDLIWPLASRGIVAKVGEFAIVYDAETATGGSGGPVLDLNGQVIAVNSAILPEFGGSNLGVPVERLRKMLGAIGTN